MRRRIEFFKALLQNAFGESVESSEDTSANSKANFATGIASCDKTSPFRSFTGITRDIDGSRNPSPHDTTKRFRTETRILNATSVFQSL